MKTKIKLNVGASPIWNEDDWYKLDHKKSHKSKTILGDAANIELEDESVDVIFCSHVIEHIPQIKIEKVFNEFNRILVKGGVLRILSPDMEKILNAYSSKDEKFFRNALSEDPNIRIDLGYGGIVSNWFNSPGQDTILLDRKLENFITGVAHQYLYDFNMLEILLKKAGFSNILKKDFCDSEIEELTIPLHVAGLEPKWQNFNKEFYKENNLIHEYNPISGKYEINFSVKGFDRDPITSLIVECKKEKNIPFGTPEFDNNNYNVYGFSLLKDSEVRKRLDDLNINYPRLNE